MHVNPSRRLTALIATALPVALALSGHFWSSTAADKDDDEEVIVLSPFEVSTGGSFGATPGGAQDINFFRMGAGRGQIPHPNSLTPEGLFSEHDLPLELGTAGKTLFRVQAAAAPAQFEVLPEVRYLAQLGFSSSLRPDTWKRAPLNLVAVVDKSGSMSGEPLALVRASLHSALGHMRDGDQLSIVLYGDQAHVLLAPTPVNDQNRAVIAAGINQIQSAGSTYMEAGLHVGFTVARESRATFKGTTRVMLFTDERPNVGNTAAASFMAMAEAASRDGVGLTTIGVSVQFGADLATKISSVRGGNLFFFEDGAQMKETFASDFEMMVTELAYDFGVRITPVPGLRVAGVFGVPAEMLRWDGDALVLDVATIFLSKRKGAIYFALAPEKAGGHLPVRHVATGAPLAKVDFNYTDSRDGAPVRASSECRLLAPEDIQSGLSRGVMLVDQYLTLKKAAQVHLFDNDQETAYRLVRGLDARLHANPDAALDRERGLVRDVHNTLALLSGHTGEIKSGATGENASPLIGVWRRTNGDPQATAQEYLVVWPNGVIEPMTVDQRTKFAVRRDAITLAGALPTKGHGLLNLADDDTSGLDNLRFEITADRLTLNVSDWPDDSTVLVLDRCSFADLDLNENREDGPRIDQLSGLPVTRGLRTSMQRARRLGLP